MSMYMDYLKHHGIIGMKWGVRRYQNKDGSLTPAGQRRYEREVLKNNQKKKKDRIDEDSLRDPHKWVKDDLSNTRNAVDNANRGVNAVSDLNREIRKLKRRESPKLDLSSMSDSELRDRINRMNMEKQYQSMMSEKYVESGRSRVDDILSTVGPALTITSSALGIALAIKQLKS